MGTVLPHSSRISSCTAVLLATRSRTSDFKQDVLDVFSQISDEGPGHPARSAGWRCWAPSSPRSGPPRDHGSLHSDRAISAGG